MGGVQPSPCPAGRRLGVERCHRGHVLRCLCPHHRGRPQGRSRSARCPGEPRQPPGPRGVAARHGAAVPVDACGRGGRLPRRACKQCIGHRAPQEGRARDHLAADRSRHRHDAGHDVCVARIRFAPHPARPSASAALGLMAHRGARHAVLVPAFPAACLAGRAASSRQHGPSGGHRHGGHLRREHAGDLSAPGPVRQGSLFRLPDHVRLLPPHRTVAGGAPARSHGRRPRSPDESPARQCGAAQPQDPCLRTGHPAQAQAGGHRARSARRIVPGRRSGAGGAHHGG